MALGTFCSTTQASAYTCDPDGGSYLLSNENNMVAVNLTGSFLCAQEAIKIMKAQKPRELGASSTTTPFRRTRRVLTGAPYSATKHAIAGLTKSISLDCRVRHRLRADRHRQQPQPL